jgi:hypothetical protein
MHSFTEVIDRLGGSAAVARGLGRRAGTVRQWRNRNSVPPVHWSRLVAYARARGEAGVTHEILAGILTAIAEARASR